MSTTHIPPDGQSYRGRFPARAHHRCQTSRPTVNGHLEVLHDHVWCHLLDPERELAPLQVVGQALVAVGATDKDHPLLRAVDAVDDAGRAADAPPPALVDVLSEEATGEAWIGSIAIGVTVAHGDAVDPMLEALVGHPTASPSTTWATLVRPTVSIPSQLLCTAVENQDRWYLGHRENLNGVHSGAFHLRPAPADTAALHIRLQGPAHRHDIGLEIDPGA